jgi:chemotaxis protein histidine kinase CheA
MSYQADLVLRLVSRATTITMEMPVAMAILEGLLLKSSSVTHRVWTML